MSSHSSLDPSNRAPSSFDESAEATKAPESFPIVGIGASAGGLEAFRDLLQDLPVDSGMAYVLVQHLDPKHESALTELLSRATKIAVTEVQQDTRVQPNHVYVIPRNADMELREGTLHLTPRILTSGKHMPIDQFLRSLAKELGSQAIAVILSGSASDGALGVTDIKAQGGITFAQDKTAQYDGMPRSAIASGHVDFVLAPKDIAQELSRIATHPYFMEQREHHKCGTDLTGDAPPELLTVLALLRQATGIDFTLYKHGTLTRRIQRRIALLRLDSLGNYVEYMREHGPEVEALYQDLLINVTSFFREPEAFDTLKRIVFPKLIEGRLPDDPIRIWVPGCSTGEEVYSLAMCLLEFMGDAQCSAPLKLFATDVSDRALQTARQGFYLENIASDCSRSQLSRFFRPQPGGYQVIKTLRDMCVFAKHDITKDPPFATLDIISCRNVLIYFGPLLQKRLIPIFHYSLKSTGFLVLGASETLSHSSDLFALREKRYKIYCKQAHSTRHVFGFSPKERALGVAIDRRQEQTTREVPDITKDVDRFIVERYSPACVVVNQDLNIVQVRGDTGPYLRLAPGEVSVDVLKMAKEDLSLELRQTLHEAKKSGRPVQKQGLQLRTNDRHVGVNVEVVPLPGHTAEERCFLIVFEAVRGRPPLVSETETHTVSKWFRSLLGLGVRGEPSDEHTKPQESEQVQRLREELNERKTYLQSLIQEQETTNEELRAANEESLSANEELLSTNEELETAKEELQATNEEISTVNAELQSRNLEMGKVNDDLSNLLSSANIPIIMVGGDLSIRRFTPTAATLLNLIEGDVGRRIGQFKPQLNVPDLDTLLDEVITRASVREREVRDQEGRWYHMVISPYWTQEKKIDGAVIALADIDEIKRSEELLRASRDYAISVVETVRTPLVVLDAALHVIRANRAFYTLFRVSREETETELIYALGNEQWNIPTLRELLEQILPKESTFNDFEVEHEFPHIGRKIMLITGRCLEDNAKQHILLGMEDVTERKLAQRKLLAHLKRRGKRLHESKATTKSIVETTIEGIVTIDTTGVIKSFNPAAAHIFGYKPHEVAGKNLKMLMPLPYREEHDVYIAGYLRTGEGKVNGVGREVEGLRKDGGAFPMELSVSEIDSDRNMGFTVIVRDISERKRSEEALRTSEERFRLLVEGVTDYAIFMLDTDGHVISWNRGAERIKGYQAEEIVGKYFSCFYPPEEVQRGKPEEDLKRAAAEGRCEAEGLRVHKDGSQFCASVVITALWDHDGQLRGYCEVTRDMTERKQAERALLQSERLAAIGEAIAGLSHESGNALQRSQSSLQSLRREVKDQPEALHLIEEIQKAQDDLHRLYEDVREYAKPMTLQPAVHHLGNILREAWGQLEPLREERETRLQESAGRLDLRCEVDEFTMRQVFRNVLENALQACGARAEIEVEYSELEIDGRPALQAAVRDNGPGLSLEQRQRIFDSFFTTKEHGSGLGMAIAKRIVEAHRGEIAAGPGSGGGAEILINVPRRQQ